MMSCEEATRVISDGLDTRVSVMQRVNLRLHLFFCVHCRRFREQTVLLRTLLRRYASGDTPEAPRSDE